MAVIDDLLAELPETLRPRLAAEVGRLREPSRFGLQFERHIPEYLAVPGTRLRKGVRVALRDAPMSDTFVIQRLHGPDASLLREAGGAMIECPREQLVPVKRFGEAVLAALRQVQSVVRAARGRPPGRVASWSPSPQGAAAPRATTATSVSSIVARSSSASNRTAARP